MSTRTVNFSVEDVDGQPVTVDLRFNPTWLALEPVTVSSDEGFVELPSPTSNAALWHWEVQVDAGGEFVGRPVTVSTQGGDVDLGVIVVAIPGEVEVAWGDVQGKPSTFPPSAPSPANHSHATSEVTGLQGALDGKAATNHSHSDLQDAIDGKAATSHSHDVADVTGLQAALDALDTRITDLEAV